MHIAYPWCVEIISGGVTKFHVFDTQNQAGEYAHAIQVGGVKVVGVWEL